MKKHLFTCFLASLCLYGSSLTAQVADSPTGADFLHRSRPIVPHGLRDTHRGGETRSDTLSSAAGLLHPAAQAERPVFLYGELESPYPIDSLKITFWEHYLDRFVTNTGVVSTYVVPVQGSLLQGAADKWVFAFTSPGIGRIGYLSLSNPSGDFFFDRYLVEPGDSVFLDLNLKEGSLGFSGPAAPKFEAQYQLDRARKKQEYLQPPTFHLSEGQDPAEREQYYRSISADDFPFSLRTMGFISSGEERTEWVLSQMETTLAGDPRMAVFEAYRESLSPEVYQVLLANTIGSYGYAKMALLKNLDSAEQDLRKKLLEELWLGMQKSPVADSVAVLSSAYADFLLEKISMESLQSGIPLFTLVAQKYSGELHDLLLGKFLLANYRRLPDFERNFTSALDRITTPYLRESIAGLLEVHRHGATVEELELISEEGERTSLADYQGKTVLLAFWFSGCLPSKMLHERQLTEVMEELGDRKDFELLSISTDPTQEIWRQYLNETPSYHFGNTHLYMGGRDVHPFLAHYDIIAYPQMMLIDASGHLVRSVKMPSSTEGLINLISPLLTGDDSANLSTYIQP
ncbi:TlpA family protein disulfide reductase [Algoriphagus sp.]|uniref:TlpA family protein disulfide reductase n=1 Tax=Algoriphagus sp. TaxID=1872435 RepID=UPI003F6E5701